MMRQRRGSIGLIKDESSKKLLVVRLILVTALLFMALSGLVGVMSFSCVHGTSI